MRGLVKLKGRFKQISSLNFFGDLKKVQGVFKDKNDIYSKSVNGVDIKIKKSESEEIIAFNFKISHKDAGKKGKRVIVGIGSFYSSRFFIKEKIWLTFTYILMSELIKTISIFILLFCLLGIVR